LDIEIPQPRKIPNFACISASPGAINFFPARAQVLRRQILSRARLDAKNALFREIGSQPNRTEGR
jgi:hypothetical protein